MRYERRIREELDSLFPGVVHEQWFEYVDDNGIGYCQSDHFIVLDTVGIVFETKLTQVAEAVRQINLLYRPVLEFHYGLPFIGVQVCKNLRTDPGDRLIRNPAAIPKLRPSNRVWVMHRP